MANIRPTRAKTPAAFPSDQTTGNRELEPFFWKLLLLSAMAYFVWSEKVSIDIGFVAIRKAELSDQFERQTTDFFGLLGLGSKSGAGVRIEEGAVNNLTFVLDPGYAHRYQIDDETVRQSREQCRQFVKQFSPVAIAEMRRFGVPASILLAQSLLASDAGADALTLQTNNFFLRTCHNEPCRAKHTDLAGDVEVDVFPNLWGSFRAQSVFFKNADGFRTLLDRRNQNAHTWAKALDVLGYSTDPEYGAKILTLVKSMDLESFDQG